MSKINLQIAVKLSVSKYESDKVCRSCGTYFVFHREEIETKAETTYNLDETNRIRAICPDFWTKSIKLFFTLWALWNACDSDLTFYGSFNSGENLIKIAYYDLTFKDFVQLFSDNVEAFEDGYALGLDLLKRYDRAY